MNFLDAIGWLDTADSYAAARSELSRHRLPDHLVEDVLQEARVKVWRAAPDQLENPAAYGRRTLTSVVLDLHRAADSRIAPIPLEEHDPAGGDFALPTILVEADCRRVAADSIAACAWAAAATLTQLTFVLYPGVAVPMDAPQTDGDDRAIDWAALWLAGRADCFGSSSAPETAAIRQRRKRALDAANDHMRRVVQTALGEATDD